MKRQKMTRAAGRVLLALVVSFALVMAGCGQPGDGYEGDDGNKTEQNGDGNGDTSGGGNGQQTGGGSGDGDGQQTGGGSGNAGGSGSGEVDDSKDTFGVVNWGPIECLGDGAENGPLGNKYKIYIETDTEKPKANNIQKTAQSNNSIHVWCNYANAITSLGKGNFSTTGADLYLYLTNFKAKETKFTITDGGTEYTCYVYYADGTGTEVIDIEYSNDPVLGDDGKINWNNEDWIASANVDGVIYEKQYKIIAPVGIYDTIQKSGSAVKAAIYIRALPSTFSSCSLSEDEYIGSADYVYLYIDAFKSKETKFTITLQDGSENEFWVYNDQGEDGIDDRTSSAGEDTTE